MSNEERLNQLIEELGAIIKDLGVATAYGYAVEKGYEGTEEEFAELMADYAHVAQDAEAAAQSASESATAAHNSEVNAGNSEGLAEQAKLDAQASAQAADVSEANAKISELNADTHAENAEAWAVGTRDGSPVGQGDPTYHNNAKYYAELADTKADQAATSAEESQDAAVVAQSAATSATASATAADASKVAAKASEDNAKDSEDAAKVSEQNAKDSEDAAKTSEDNAKASENTASNAAVSAMNSRDAAASSATNAAGSASTATQKASEASQSATSASGSASTATQKATDASNSASAAAQSAADAAESATHVADMALMEAIAPKWVNNVQYKIGNLLSASGKMYLTIKDAPAGTPVSNTEYFEEKSVADIIEMIKTGKITVGKATLADNFDSKMTLADKSGYLFRTAGGSLEIGGQSKVKKIIGASVPIIQQLRNPNFADNTIWFSNTEICSKSVANNIFTTTFTSTPTEFYQSGIRSAGATVEFINGHKYLAFIDVKPSKTCTYRFYSAETNYSREVTCSANVWTKVMVVVTAAVSRDSTTVFFGAGTALVFVEGDTVQHRNAGLIDLTATFGTTVANRLYALEQAQAGAGIAKAKEILVKDYYPYNVTAFTHTKTSGKVNNGFNQWDELWELGYWNGRTGAPESNSNRIRCKNFIDVLPNTSYFLCMPVGIGATVLFFDIDEVIISSREFGANNTNKIFTTPYNCHFIKFNPYTEYGATYKNDICINLHWDGERDGEYEPYQEWNYPVQDIELKGILSLDAQDNWVADGDEYLPSGVVDENYFEQDLGELTWTRTADAQGGYVFWAPLPNGKQSSGSYGYESCRCAKYVARNYSAGALDNLEMTQGSQFTSSSANIAIRDDAYSTASAFKTAVTGLILLFKGATPTESSADPYTELQNDSNWGTEKWIDNRDVPLPVFSEAEYLPDLKAKVEVAPESPTEDGDYIMHRENGLNSYGSLSTWLSANGYNKMQDLSSAITDVAGLTYSVKRLIVSGNLINLTVKAQNNTGASIADQTTLFSIPSALGVGEGYNFVGCNGTDVARVRCENNHFKIVGSIQNSGIIYVNISYIKAYA